VRVLVDTCAWSLLLRRKNKTDLSEEEKSLLASLTEAIKDVRVAIIGPIRQEVLSGIKELAQFEKTESRACRPSGMNPHLTPLRRCRAPFQPLQKSRSRVRINRHSDLPVAIQKHSPLLTNDGGIKRCIDVLGKPKA